MLPSVPQSGAGHLYNIVYFVSPEDTDRKHPFPGHLSRIGQGRSYVIFLVAEWRAWDHFQASIKYRVSGIPDSNCLSPPTDENRPRIHIGGIVKPQGVHEERRCLFRCFSAVSGLRCTGRCDRGDLPESHDCPPPSRDPSRLSIAPFKGAAPAILAHLFRRPPWASMPYRPTMIPTLPRIRVGGPWIRSWKPGRAVSCNALLFRLG